MTATEPVSATVSPEELYAFHLTGRGLDHLRVGPIQPLAATTVPAPPNETEFQAAALPVLYGAAFTANRAAAKARFLRELRQCVTDLQDLLAVDDAKLAPPSQTQVAASLGADSSRFLSVSGLMAIWARRAGKPAVLALERRERCRAALGVLETALRTQQDSPAFWLFHAEQDIPSLTAVGGRSQQNPDPSSHALAFCEQQLQALTPTLRAMRIARLEAVSAWDPALHETALQRLDWQTAEPHELAAMPGVIALEAAARISLSSFSRVLRSDLPVQILIAHAEPDDADPGAIARAHHRAFVLQTSLARPDHLSRGFSEMAQILAPAVAVVAVPSPDADPATAWREAVLLAASQAWPLYRYAPDRDGEWADRFEICDATSDGFEVLILATRLHNDLRVLPSDTSNLELTDLADYLKKPQSSATLPCLIVTDAQGTTHRLMVSRRVVRLCQDRSRAWEMLAATPATVAEGDMTQIRQAAAKEAYLRVVALLADPEKLVRRP